MIAFAYVSSVSYSLTYYAPSYSLSIDDRYLEFGYAESNQLSGWHVHRQDSSSGRAVRLPYLLVRRFSIGKLLLIPLWIPFALLALPTGILAWLHHRRLRGHCRRCGYILAPNTSGECPECGERIIGDDHRYCPRCDYNLIGNTSGTCPECGERIVEDKPKSRSGELR
jgi:predicted RNA-binding Zn-ribbon protein involved in translation (DUF1610 family)